MEGGGVIGFEVSEAVTITLIGIGTAFCLLALLSLMTAVLPRVVGLLGGEEEEGVLEEETASEERNKALAATIAVSVAMGRGDLEVGDAPPLDPSTGSG